MTPTISSLLSRVRAASGPDRRIDRDIAIAIGSGDLGNAEFTGSIDSAVALVERVLGCSWRVGNTPSGRGFCYLGTSLVEHDAATPPLAILAALLSALEQKESAG